MSAKADLTARRVIRRLFAASRKGTVTAVQGKNIFFRDILEEGVWSQTIASLSTSSLYTSWAWGEYKRRMAWKVHRVSVCDRSLNKAVGCFQLQKKKLGPICILFIQGGIHLKHLSHTDYHEVLQSFLSAYVAQKKNTIVIINHQAGSSQDVELSLLRSRFTPVINSRMYTFVLDSIDRAIDGEALSQNWRHNLKRALNNERMSVKWIDNLSERTQSLTRLETFYADLMNRKLFSPAINFDLARDIIVESENFKIVEARLDGNVIAIRVGFFGNDHVVDFLAASSEAATKTYANYLLLWKMIEMARSSGKSYFDCGGINPADNMGVYNFKKGLGGRLVVSGPIWLYGSSSIVTKSARLLLSWEQ